MAHVTVNALYDNGHEHDEKYAPIASDDKYQTKTLSNPQKIKKCGSSFLQIILVPFLLPLLILTLFLSHSMITNMICSITSCILIGSATSSSMKSMNNNVIYIYISFIVRNVVHTLILSHYKYPYNKLRLGYNIATSLTIIAITLYDVQNSDYDLYHISMILMSSTMILCDLWMVSSFTFQPNKLFDKYFEINEELLSDLQFVGKHASEIQLNEMSLCINEMKRVYKSNITRIISNRKQQLNNLLRMLTENEERITNALKLDLGRGGLMAVSYAIYPIVSEIKLLLNNIDEWSAPQSMGISLVTFPSTDYHISEPLGTVFINSIWNFPFQLSLTPIVGAICAGNNVVIKTCNTALNSSNVLCDLLHQYVDSRFVQCVGHSTIAGGDDRILTAKILENEFDLIFFTGSSNGGKYIMGEAAKNLTPVILELGGKNPCFVDNSANIGLAARQLIYGRVLNCGQQCVSPDYVFICKDVLNEFIVECRKCINKWYKLKDELKDDLGINQCKIINEDQFKRVCGLLNSTKGKVICGGHWDANNRMIEPTVVLLSEIKHISNEPTIKTETFGPVLWIIPIHSNDIKEAVHYVNDCGNGKPLALYVFSECRKIQNYIVNNTSSGAVQINGTIVYAAHHNARFGGVGVSGIGCYHGKHSFDAFTHKKPVVRSWIEQPLAYPPYNLWKKTIFSLVL